MIIDGRNNKDSLFEKEQYTKSPFTVLHIELLCMEPIKDFALADNRCRSIIDCLCYCLLPNSSIIYFRTSPTNSSFVK